MFVCLIDEPIYGLLQFGGRKVLVLAQELPNKVEEYGCSGRRSPVVQRIKERKAPKENGSGSTEVTE